MTFGETLSEQRWDDHRFYHHSRINQSLHLVSALSFIAAYVMLFVEPAIAVMIAWLISMPTRQAGHFFFEPLGYDEANQATHEHKEAVKVGYNLQRKVVLLSIWVLSPLLLVWSPTLGGTMRAHSDLYSFTENVATLWLAVGAGALAFRTLQLFVQQDVQTGLV